MKLKANTSLIIIVASAILLEVISAVQYYYTRSLLADELELRAESELTTKAVVVKSSLTMSENSLRGHIWDMMRNISCPDSLFNAVEWVLRTHPKLFGCGIAFVPGYYPEKGRLFEPYAYRENGEVKTRQIAGPHHDYTESGFYTLGINADSPVWTEPYTDDLFKVPMVSYVVPIRDDNQETIAIFALDIPLSVLGDTLNYRHIYPSSFDFLLTESGTFIAGPRSDDVKKNDLEQVIKIINDSTIEKSPSESGRSKVATFYDSTDGDKGYVFFGNIKGEPHWQIAVVCYDKEVYGKLRMMRLNIGVLMLAGLVIISLMVVRFARNDRKLHAVNMEKQRIDSELHVASQIQQSMLPKEEVRGEWLEVRGSLVPAREVGGDLYDYYIRDEKLFFCIGDVSGKGAPSAMVMAVIHSLFRAFSIRENNPARIMQAINEASCRGNESSMFVTFFLGVLDLPTGHLRYCNGGHDAPMMIRGEGQEVRGERMVQIPVLPNLPVGLFDDVKYGMQEMKLEPDSTIFLYTDGLTEAMNSQRKQFGMKRIEQVLGSCINLHPEEIINTMIAAVHGFVKDAEQSDDLTMLAIRYTPKQFESTLTETLHIKNDVKEIAKFSSFMKSTMEKLDIDKSLARQLRLAVEEAVVNVVDYAYPVGQKGEIDIRLMSDGKSLKTVIIDSGVAFDPTAVDQTDTTLSVEDRQVGGLGILLVRELMDSVNYERVEGKNVLTLTKTIIK